MGEFCPALLADTISRAVSNLGSVYGEVVQGTRARSECRGGVLLCCEPSCRATLDFLSVCLLATTLMMACVLCTSHCLYRSCFFLFFARPQPLWQVLSGGLAIERVRACLYMHDVMQLSVSLFRFAFDPHAVERFTSSLCCPHACFLKISRQV